MGPGPGLVAHVLWRYCMRLTSSGVGGVRPVWLAFGRHPMPDAPPPTHLYLYQHTITLALAAPAARPQHPMTLAACNTATRHVPPALWPWPHSVKIRRHQHTHTPSATRRRRLAPQTARWLVARCLLFPPVYELMNDDYEIL